MERVDGYSLDIQKQNIEKIKEIFPEAVEEGKINFEVLKEFLGGGQIPLEKNISLHGMESHNQLS